jgi:hypothetical protein
MDGQAFGQLFDGMIKGFIAMIFGVAITTALVVGLVVWGIMAYSRPTPESIEKEKSRQQVISTLTPEQRKALGL